MALIWCGGVDGGNPDLAIPRKRCTKTGTGSNPGSPSLQSRQPPLPPPVVLHVAEALAPACGQAQVELLHVLVRSEVGSRPVHDHAAIFQDIAVVGVAQ